MNLYRRIARMLSCHVFGVALLVMLCVTAATWGDRLRNVVETEQIPNFALSTLDGQEVTAESLRGKVVVLSIVSAEQASSEKAQAAVHELRLEMRRDDLAVLFVTADTTRVDYFRQFRDAAGVHEPLLLDHNRQLYGDLGIIVLPTTLVIDREGRLAKILSGHRSDYPDVLAAYVRHTLGLIDDAQLEQLLTTERFEHNRPLDRAARHRAAAALLRGKGLLADAENELRTALEIAPNHVDVLLDLASLKLVAQQVDEAATMVEQVLAADPGSRHGKLMRGIVLFYQGDYDAAEPALREVLLLNPDPARTHYYLGRIAEVRGDSARAIEHYRTAAERLLEDNGS